MALFVVLESARFFVPLSAVLKRELFVLNVLAAFLTLFWLTSHWDVRELLKLQRGSWQFGIGVRVVMVLLAASFTSNFFGYRSISQVLGIGAFLGFMGAAALFGAVRVLTLLLITLLHSDWARSALETRTRAVEYWGSRGLVFVMTLVWVRGMLQLFTVYEPMIDAVTTTLEAGWVMGMYISRSVVS